MAISRGTRTALANVSRLHSVPDGQARAFGEVDCSGGEHALELHLLIPINSSATDGTYDVYLVESQDGAEWTDDIDPTADTGDVAAKLSDARLLASLDTTYHATNRPNAELHLSVPLIGRPSYAGLVVVNNSQQTTPASGADGDSVLQTVS